MLFSEKYRSIITAVIIIIISLVIFSYNYKQTTTGIVRKLVIEVSAPFIFAINESLKVVNKSWERYIFLMGLEEENRSLRKQNAQLMGELIKYQEGYIEVKRLQSLIKLKDHFNYATIAARVISKSPSSVFKTILINRGFSHGLRIGFPVVVDRGIVGRVVETSWNVSRILLVIDENSNVDALIQRSRAQGILHGSGYTKCNLKYVPKTEDVRIGDVIISSGLDGVFPKGITLGVITNIMSQEAGLFRQIEVSPSVDFTKLEEVLVLLTGNHK